MVRLKAEIMTLGCNCNYCINQKKRVINLGINRKKILTFSHGEIINLYLTIVQLEYSKTQAILASNSFLHFSVVTITFRRLSVTKNSAVLIHFPYLFPTRTWTFPSHTFHNHPSHHYVVNLLSLFFSFASYMNRYSHFSSHSFILIWYFCSTY